MFTLKTHIELIRIIENYNHSELDRLLDLFNIKQPFAEMNPSKAKKANEVLYALKNNKVDPIFTDNGQIDLLQYIVDEYYNKNKSFYNDPFLTAYPNLKNALIRDGYTIEAKNVKKLLPSEIQEAKIDTELFQLLEKYNFIVSKTHLSQAISNHSQGNWAGANSQFRTFIESLLIDVAKYVLPNNEVKTCASAINLLANSINPPFLKKELNEVSNNEKDVPFVIGLWKRLHPEGSHPGLSDESDCTFRFHIILIFSHNILKRLEQKILTQPNGK